MAEDAELRARLQAALAQTGLELEKLALQRSRAHLADRQDARRTSVSRREAGGGDLRGNVMLITAFVAVTAIVALLIMTPDVPPEVTGFVIGIGGMFARNIGSAFDFEFGSSRGSRDKDGQIESQMRRMAQFAEAASGPAENGGLGSAGAIAARAQRVRAILRGS
jgi:hypothetical protein